jgi:6-phosphofructokinase 1
VRLSKLPVHAITYRLWLVRGCDTWIVREGYEGLVRGNTEWYEKYGEEFPSPEKTDFDTGLLSHLRFGDGDLLKDGTGDHPSGRTLKGRYIVRVGWDDVRGWLGQVRDSAFRG